MLLIYGANSRNFGKSCFGVLFLRSSTSRSQIWSMETWLLSSRLYPKKMSDKSEKNRENWLLGWCTQFQHRHYAQMASHYCMNKLYSKKKINRITFFLQLPDALSGALTHKHTDHQQNEESLSFFFFFFAELRLLHVDKMEMLLFIYNSFSDAGVRRWCGTATPAKGASFSKHRPRHWWWLVQLQRNWAFLKFERNISIAKVNFYR